MHNDLLSVATVYLVTVCMHACKLDVCALKFLALFRYFFVSLSRYFIALLHCYLGSLVACWLVASQLCYFGFFVTILLCYLDCFIVLLVTSLFFFSVASLQPERETDQGVTYILTRGIVSEEVVHIESLGALRRKM